MMKIPQRREDGKLQSDLVQPIADPSLNLRSVLHPTDPHYHRPLKYPSRNI